MPLGVVGVGRGDCQHPPLSAPLLLRSMTSLSDDLSPIVFGQLPQTSQQHQLKPVRAQKKVRYRHSWRPCCSALVNQCVNQRAIAVHMGSRRSKRVLTCMGALCITRRATARIEKEPM